MTAHAKLSTLPLTARLTSPAVHYSREFQGCEMSQTGNEGMEGGTQDLSPQTLWYWITSFQILFIIISVAFAVSAARVM